MDEGKKKIVIYAAVGVVVVAVLLLAVYLGKNSGSNPQGNEEQANQENQAVGGVKPSETRQPLSLGVDVPGVSSTIPSNVAGPQLVVPAAPGSSSNFRIFSISVSGDKFSPDTVIVKVGDQLRMNITAVDKDYDFYQPDYGMSTPLPKGQTKNVSFQASAADKYTFYCKSCGGPSKGPVGYLVVSP